MRAFTLIEVVIVLLLLSLIVSIGFNFSSLNKDFFYLRDVSKNFAFSLNTISDMAQRVIEKNNQFFCAYGIYFSSSTSYEVLALSTSTKLCEFIFSSSTLVNNFINQNLNSKNFILMNQDIVSDINQYKTLSLNLDLKQNNYFYFSTSSKDCSTNQISTPLFFLYAYGYSDLFFLYQRGSSNWENITTDKIYICLKKVINGITKEKFIIKINKLGQINFEK